MFPGALEGRIQHLVLFCVFSMTLVVTPWLSLDPINLPKFLILGVCGFAAIGSVAPYLKQLAKAEARIVLWGVIFFVASLVAVSLFSGAGIWAQFYGARGRNTGLLSNLRIASTTSATWPKQRVCLPVP